MTQKSERTHHEEVHWGSPPLAVDVTAGELHLWLVRLDQSSNTEVLFDILSSDEKERARRFHFERDRRRFTVARAHLRSTLARYLNAEPSSIAFSYGHRGKPSLAALCGSDTLKFNLSHSGELALLAVTPSRELGADIEQNKSIAHHDRIAERFFFRAETAVLPGLLKKNKLYPVFWCWTCKEAYVKATGDGLARTTESFDVVFLPPEHARVAEIDGSAEQASRWTLFAFTPADRYVAAVALEGELSAVSCFESVFDKQS